MRQLLKAWYKFCSTKNVKDIVENYTRISGCDRIEQIAK